VEIVKASGEREKFKKRSIEKSIIRAGGSRELAESVAKEVERKAQKGVWTEKILDLVLEGLRGHPDVAMRYDLKRAIMNLGPSGFPFEEFVSQVLRNYGYKTTVGKQFKGKAISQEVDIVAELNASRGSKVGTSEEVPFSSGKDSKVMIEAKYHNSPGIYTDTKVAMYTYARFLDVKSNRKNKFNKVWLITNTKCTSRAVRYAEGVELKIIGWRYPKKWSLQELVEEKGLYPVTVFRGISEEVLHQLFKAKIVLAKDLVDFKLEKLKRKTGLDEVVLKKIMKEARLVVKGE
jgi:hypothetical protein